LPVEIKFSSVGKTFEAVQSYLFKSQSKSPYNQKSELRKSLKMSLRGIFCDF
jgi:hypothetical protein